MCQIVEQQVASSVLRATLEQREYAASRAITHAEALRQIVAEQGNLCELCETRNHAVRIVGSPLSYWACADLTECQKRREADLLDVSYPGVQRDSDLRDGEWPV